MLVELERVRRLLTLEDTIDIHRGLPKGFGRINSIGHEAAASDIVTIRIPLATVLQRQVLRSGREELGCCHPAA
jgi:hypothetical protein